MAAVRRHVDRGHAVLMGDRDLAAPLAAVGVGVTLVCQPTAATRYSRYLHGWLDDPRPDEDALAAALVRHAGQTAGPVALYYQSDEELLFVSRRRTELAAAGLLFVVPSADLVESLVDKSAFAELADRLRLPVPATTVLDPASGVRGLRGLGLPLIVKPLRRADAWGEEFAQKAVLVDREADLARILETLAPHHAQVLAQVPVSGPESRIESYHAYVDTAGALAGEFTGRKVRTLPAAFGHSTAVQTTDSADVRDLGRAVVERIGLRGVVKVDFKRDPDGRLWLLEVNPRYNLWHHVGAAAGVNLPAMVWADLVGLPRPGAGPARAGVTWAHVERDWKAARQVGMGNLAWLRWVVSCDTRTGLDPADPLPIVAKALSLVRRRTRSVVSGDRRR